MFKALLARLRPDKSEAGNRSAVRAASAYFLDPQLVICAQSQTRDGFFIDDGPRHIPDSANPVAVGEAVLKSLSQSRRGLDNPRDFKAMHQPTLDAFGLTARAFSARARLVFIEAVEGGVRFTPSANRGAKEGFHGLPESATEAPLEPAELGRGLLEALARAVV